MRALLIAPLLFASLATPAHAQQSTAAAVSAGARVARALDANVLRSHLEFLADDALEGRAPGTRGGDAAAKLTEAENAVTTLQTKLKDCQRAGHEWQFRCHDLQKQVDEMEAMIPKGGMPARKPVESPPETPAAPAPAPAAPVTEQARIEARKILAEARLNAENAERRSDDRDVADSVIA